jgi:hypothetical protein
MVRTYGPAPEWQNGPRVRVDTLRKGQRFIAYDGVTYTYERIDGALSGVHHVTDGQGRRTCFAGCAEGVLK